MSLLGRKAEIDQLQRAFASHRLTVLVGPAGVGKTTLAAHWAETVSGSFFVGLQAATAVLSDEPAESRRILRRLIDTSLLQANDDTSGRRFDLLETIRVFAEELADASPNAASVRRHADHYGEVAGNLRRSFNRADEAQAVEMTLAERDNFLAVLRHREQVPPSAVLHCAAALAPWYMSRHGPVSRYHDILEEIAGVARRAPADLRGRFESQRGWTRYYLGDFDAAATHHQKAVELLRPDGPSAALAMAIRGRGMIAVYLDRYDEAKRHFEEAREMAATLDDPFTEGRAVLAEGNLALSLRQLREALAHYERARVLLEGTASSSVRAVIEANRALTLQRLDDLERAARGLERAMTLENEAGSRRAQIETARVYAENRVRVGDYGRAIQLVEHAEELMEETGWSALRPALEVLRGQCSLGRGDAPDAVERLERASHLIERTSDTEVTRVAGLLSLALAEICRSRTTEARLAISEATEIRDGPPHPRLMGCVECLYGALEESAEIPDVDEDAVLARFRDLCVALSRGESDEALLAADPADDIHFETRVLRDLLRARVTTTEQVVVVAPEAHSVRLQDGTVVDLSRRQAIRRVFLALSKTRVERPGDALGVYELFDAGWPGEAPDPELAANRVYNSIYVLRNLGLDSLIIKLGDGYMIDPEVELTHR